MKNWIAKEINKKKYDQSDVAVGHVTTLGVKNVKMQNYKTVTATPTFSTNTDKLHPLAFNELQCFVHICNFVKPHFASVWFGKLFSRYDFK